MANVDNGNGKKKKKNKKKKTKYNVGNTLLSTSNVILVGFPLADLILNHNARKDPPTRNNANDFIGKMLTEDANGDLPPGFARIFGFIASGVYVDLDAPTIFLVHGGGTKLENFAGQTNDLATQSFRFPEDKANGEVMGWSYDENDFSMCLDVSTGPIADLIEAGMGAGGTEVSGARVSGARVSGARVSGARVSGARVSGARVSGARVSGARVSGARVSGSD